MMIRNDHWSSFKKSRSIVLFRVPLLFWVFFSVAVFASQGFAAGYRRPPTSGASNSGTQSQDAQGSYYNSYPTVGAPNGSSPSNGYADSGYSNRARKPIFASNTPFSPGSSNVALAFGQVFLMGDLADNYGDSLGTQLQYTYGVSDVFAFDSALAYSSHSEGKFSMTQLRAGIRGNIAWYDKVIPYGVFGFGFYMPSYELSKDESISPIVFGLHAGGGVDLEVSSQIFFGGELLFNDAFNSTRETSAGFRDVGGTFTSLLLRAGMTF